MILVFSSASNRSAQVSREVERAVSKGLFLIPFRLEDVPMSKTMGTSLAPHWLDAMTPPLESHLEVLAQTVKSLACQPQETAALTPVHAVQPFPAIVNTPTCTGQQVGRQWAAGVSRNLMIVAGIALAMIVLGPSPSSNRWTNSGTRQQSGRGGKQQPRHNGRTYGNEATDGPASAGIKPGPSEGPMAGNRTMPQSPLEQITVDLGKGIRMEMLLIPAGQFHDGVTPFGRDARGEEKPQHRVRITQPFYLGKYLVTQEQWETVMGNNPSHFKGPNNPVEQISWDDCQESSTSSTRGCFPAGRFRLPTEAQWEYACRLGARRVLFRGRGVRTGRTCGV